MTNGFGKLCLAAASLLAVAGCGDFFQASANEPSLVVAQPIGSDIPGIPTGLVSALPPFSFSFDMPSTPLTEDGTNNTVGPLKVASSIQLNQSWMTIPASYSADFDGFDTLELTISGNGKSQVLARYVKDPAHLPGKSLVLARADDVEILDYVSSTSRTVTLTLSGTGSPPSSNWTADVNMDLKIAADASF